MSEKEETTIPQKKEQYSFSKLNSWGQCKYGFFLKYIKREPSIGNAFSSYGSFVHSIMEKYAKDELDLWDLVGYYEWGFDASVPEKFPWNKYVTLRDKYYQQGLNFLKSFQGYDKYKILGVEQDFELPIDDWTLVGFIDLAFVDDAGKLIVRDYKSKASFKNAEEQHKYARQLYLYSLYIKEKYGKYPDELQFLMFRNNELVSIPFNEEDLVEALEWARSTVADIRTAFDYPPMANDCADFFAENLCGHREVCEFSHFAKKGKRNGRK